MGETGAKLSKKKSPSRGALQSLSLSLPVLARVLLSTLLTAFLAALLFFTWLALLWLPRRLRLAAGLRITFAALSLLSILFVCHGTYPFWWRFKASR